MRARSMSARVLLNPSAGRGRGARLAERLAALAAGAGLPLESSASAEDLARRARRAADEGIERLFVFGGDGTWHHAANALAGSDTCLVPVPLGTGNDLARELGYPLDPEAAFRAGLEGVRERLDLGRIGDRFFCGVAGVGFDAAVAEYARTRVRRLRGPLVYAWATIASLAAFRPPAARLRAPGFAFDGEIFLAAFANTSHYGGGMRIAPDADPTDGLLDLVLVRRVSKLRLLGVFPRVYRGRHVGHPAVSIARVERLSVELDPAQPINADGEGLGSTAGAPLEVSVERGALGVVRARMH